MHADTRKERPPHLAVLLMVAVSAVGAGPGPGGGHGSTSSGRGVGASCPAAVGAVPGAVASGPIGYPAFAVSGIAYGPFVPPISLSGPVADAEPVLPAVVEVPPPPRPVDPGRSRPARFLPRDPERSDQLVTVGDRLFRAGNLNRAVERYEQALRTHPGSAAPRVRLAQVAIARGDYREAAARFREAQAAEPGWLAFPDDIQGLWPEPPQYAAMIGRIESHLQAHPDDRDAWLVLGAQLYLSGRNQPAADVFLRLTDRPPDRLLASFLNLTRPALPGQER